MSNEIIELDNKRFIPDDHIRETSMKLANELKWNERFLQLAIFISNWSKDPSSKVGAVIVDKYRRIVSMGYNGFPIGVCDLTDRLETKEVKYQMILHAEENAIMFAKRDLSECSLYVSKLPPCSHCAGLIIQSGIKKVFAQKCEIPKKWKDSFELTKQMFNEAKVQISFIELMKDSDYTLKSNL